VFWASDDIWLRLQQDGESVQVHQNPVIESGGGNTAYVNVRVRNRGCEASAATTVTLFWAKASSNLGWPAPWDGSVSATECPGSPPMGGTLGTVAVPALESGESIVIEMPWEVPDPANYECFGGNETHFCLLSHLGDVDTTPADLIGLVSGSNDVVWKNLIIATDGDLSPSFSVRGADPRSGDGLDFYSVLEPGSPVSVFDWATVSVDLGNELFASWDYDGRQGDGIASVDGTVLTLAGENASIVWNNLTEQDLATVEVLLEPLVPASAPRQPGLDFYRLGVQQFTRQFVCELCPPGKRREGGMTILVKTNAPRPSP
jgi:hypothetical protein